jgi:hypothetical protein
VVSLLVRASSSAVSARRLPGAGLGLAGPVGLGDLVAQPAAQR